MKKTTAILFISASLFISSVASAATPLNGYKWSSRTQTFQNLSPGTIGSGWSYGATLWKNNTNFNVSSSTASNLNYSAYDVSDPTASWDGLATIYPSGSTITKVDMRLNTYYTSQSKYTAAVIYAVATHEIGHSLGLDHSSASNSIMLPYTFNSNGTVARAYSLSADDKAAANSLYPTSLAATTVSTAKDSPVAILHPSWATNYLDTTALAEEADLVIAGIVEKNKGSFFKHKGELFSYTTNVNVKVKRVIKGTEDSKTIEVAQMGGNDGNILVIGDNTTLLTEKQEVVLFLKKRTDGTYAPINEDDGIYISTGNENYMNIKTKLVFRNI